jgi:hypothetical protein
LLPLCYANLNINPFFMRNISFFSKEFLYFIL